MGIVRKKLEISPRLLATFVVVMLGLVLILPSTALAAASWTPQASGTTDVLFGVDFIDTNNGWVVVNNGTILHTADGGATGSAQTSGTTNCLLGVHFIDANNGWAVGNNGTILHTTDGGATWSAQTSGTTNSLIGVHFIDTNNGWATGGMGTIRHTTDGGATWSAQASGMVGVINSVFFIDANNGWAAGQDINPTSGAILHTTDGGATWSEQTFGMTNSLRDIHFTDANNGWALGNNGTILHTANGGATWSAQTSGTTEELNGISFIDANNGLAVGWGGTILHTTDGGATWSAQTSGTTDVLWGVDLTDANNGWAVGNNGTILKYTDTGGSGGGGPCSPTWASKANMPTARFGAASGVVDGKIFVLGGSNRLDAPPLGSMGTVEMYDPSTNTWNPNGPLNSLSAPRLGAGDATQGSFIYVVGGVAGFGPPTNTVLAYNTATGDCAEIGHINTGRVRTAADIIDNKIYVVGGLGGTGASTTMEEFDLFSGSVTSVKTLPDAREMMAVVSFGGKLYIIGGFDGAGNPTKTCWEYDPLSGNITAKAEMPIARAGGQVSVYNGKILVGGGVITSGQPPFTMISDVQVYDPIRNTWSIANVPSPPTQRWGASVEVVNDSAFVIGGSDNQNALSVNESLNMSGSSCSTSDYYVYSNLNIDTITGDPSLWGAYGVDGFKGPDGVDRIIFYRNSFVDGMTGSKAYICRVTIPDGADPNMHPDNPEASGPVAPRTFTLETSFDLGVFGGHDSEFYVDERDYSIYLGAYAGIRKYIYDPTANNYVYSSDVAPPAPMEAMAQSLAYDPSSNTWYAGSIDWNPEPGVSQRRMWKYDGSQGNSGTWELAFNYTTPESASLHTHHDGMEFAGGYLYLADFTGDYIKQYTTDGALVKTYWHQPLAHELEGMGFGALTHFWCGSHGNIITEFGGGALRPTPTPNHPPVSVNDSFTMNENTSLTIVAADILSNDSDADGDSLTPIPVSGPSHGTMTPNADGSVTYTPDANYSGTDTLEYKANDGKADSNVAIVTITINPVNNAPVAANDTYGTDEDTVLSVNLTDGILANDSDADGDALSAMLVSPPSHGTLDLMPDGSLTYTPAANYNGYDSFEYKANDKLTGSNTATVTINVAAVNDAPVAVNDSFTVNEDTALTIVAADIFSNDSDADGDSFYPIPVGSGPSHGTIMPNADGSATYMPDANYNGTDSLQYKINDGSLDSNIATVTFTVNAVNDAPAILVDKETVAVNESEEATNTGKFSDIDSGSVILAASVGTVNDNGDGTWSWSYLTEDDTTDNQVVTITASDGEVTSVVSFNLTVENVAPVIDSINAPVDPVLINTPITATALYSDPGKDTHTAVFDWADGTTSEIAASGGIVTADHTYTQTGVYSIKVTVRDDDGGVAESFYQYVVVYDPSAGFVTGGGWINSPAGAYAANPDLAGKATFGFVSKYQKGSSVPTGNTEFQFHVAGMRFKSTSYEWLVVAGAKAQYKGEGTINGTGSYAFMLTAIDGQVSGGGGADKFRIKIWDKTAGSVVYDNMMDNEDTSDPTTLLSGGSIVIHKQ